MNIQQMDHISSSGLKTFLTCGEKFNKRYIENKKYPVISDALNVGKIVDEALAQFQDMTFDEITKDYFWVDAKWESYARGIFDNRAALIKKVFGDRAEFVNRQESIAVKINDKQAVTGYLDGYDAELNVIWEVKTTSGVIESVLADYRWNGQTMIYSYAKMIETGVVPIVNYAFIKKPMIRIKSGESEEEFFERMYEAGTDAQVETRMVEYGADELKKYFEYFTQTFYQIEKAEPIKNRTACFNYGSQCEYYADCWQ